MSFDLFFQPVTRGEPLGISRAELRSLFPILEDQSKPDYWKIQYDSLNACHIGLTASPSSIDLLSAFYVERPCADPQFWEAVFRVLVSGPIVLYFPGGPPIVARMEFATGLQQDVLSSLGEPRCVHSASEIQKIIRES